MNSGTVFNLIYGQLYKNFTESCINLQTTIFYSERVKNQLCITIIVIIITALDDAADVPLLLVPAVTQFNSRKILCLFPAFSLLLSIFLLVPAKFYNNLDTSRITKTLICTYENFPVFLQTLRVILFFRHNRS